MTNMLNMLNMTNMTNMTNMLNMLNMTNMTNMLNMLNMTNMTNMLNMLTMNTPILMGCSFTGHFCTGTFQNHSFTQPPLAERPSCFAHTARAPAPPCPIRVGGPDL